MKKYIHVDIEINHDIPEAIMVFSTYSSWHYQWRPDLEILNEDDGHILHYENTDWVKIEYTRRLRYKLKKYFKNHLIKHWNPHLSSCRKLAVDNAWYITSEEFFSYVNLNK